MQGGQKLRDDWMDMPQGRVSLALNKEVPIASYIHIINPTTVFGCFPAWVATRYFVYFFFFGVLSLSILCGSLSDFKQISDIWTYFHGHLDCGVLRGRPMSVHIRKRGSEFKGMQVQKEFNHRWGDQSKKQVTKHLLNVVDQSEEA